MTTADTRHPNQWLLNVLARSACLDEYIYACIASDLVPSPEFFRRQASLSRRDAGTCVANRWAALKNTPRARASWLAHDLAAHLNPAPPKGTVSFDHIAHVAR